MIEIQSKVFIKDATAQEIYDFMLACTDEDYQAWWPGTHLAWHTLQRTPDHIGDIAYFDEYVGSYRLKFHGLVTRAEPARKITWQMVNLIRLPAWLTLEFEQRQDGLHLTHRLRLGFEGAGRWIDRLLRLYFTDRFAAALDEHAQAEFPMLAQMLHTQRP